MALITPIEFVNGLFSLIIVIIYVSVGVRITLKYWKLKDRIYLFVGLTWILIIEPWYPSAVSFLLLLTIGEGLSAELFFIIGNVLLPLTTIFWFTAITEILYKEKQKMFILIFGLIGLLFEVFFFYFLFTDISTIGELHGFADANYGLFVTIYQIFLIIVVLITGILFAKASVNSGDPEIKLRGKFLYIAFISFVVGAFFDVLSPLSVLILIVGRIIMISSAIEFYAAFILPNWVKNKFLK